MKVDRIELYHVAMPLIYPWRAAYGEDHSINSVLVKVVSGEWYGWAETTPLSAPSYSPEWSGGVFRLIRDILAPRLVGHNVENPEELASRLAPYKGNNFAKAGLEIAWWVLHSKLKGKPLHLLLSGESREVPVGADFGVQDSIEILLQKVRRAVEEGYPRVKLKFRRGWDVDMLKAVRDEFPDYTFHIDCNASFTLKDLDLFKKADRFGLAMIEQPLDHSDLLDHAELQRQIETPICLDESITSPSVMEKAIHLRSCRYVNVKHGRVGGLTNAVKIHDICKDAGIPCWVGGMLESAVGGGISIELATLPNFKYPADIFPSKVQYAKDLSSPEVELSARGKMVPSNVPGIPYEPRADMLERCTLEGAVVRA